jgi:hypothetical protein
LSEVPKAQRSAKPQSLEYYASNYEPKKAMYEAYRSGHYTMKVIAEFFDVHYATVSRAIRKYEK